MAVAAPATSGLGVGRWWRHTTEGQRQRLGLPGGLNATPTGRALPMFQEALVRACCRARAGTAAGPERD